MSRTTPEVSLLIPAFNEESHLGAAVQAALATLDATGLRFEIVIVDDGSTDGSTVIAATAVRSDARVRCVRHPTNQGLGASYRTGVEAASGEFVVWLPGDDAIPPDSLLPMLAARHDVDMVVTYPVFERRRPLVRRLLSASYVELLNLAFGTRFRYFNCITLARRDLLFGVLSTTNHGFGVFAEALIRLAQGGHSYLEIGIVPRQRPIENSKALRWRNIVSVLQGVVRLWLATRHLRPPGRQPMASRPAAGKQ